ncbi:MAG: tetratricopeptide repeat protein [Gemmatimonadaceae bacterium]
MARLEELERKFEENPRRYFAPLANEYRKAGDAQRAADLCRAQLPEVPGHISGHIVLGQALYDARDFDGSRAALETALALDPENIVALRYLGDIARDTGDAAEAERCYSRTLEADPYNEAATTALQILRSAVEPELSEPVESPPVVEAAPPVEIADAALTESVPEPVVEAFAEASEAVEAVPEGAAEIEIPASGVLTVTGEFAGDLSVSTAPETERFDVAAHQSAEQEAPEEAMQTEEGVLESAAPFVTETMAELYLEQGYPHEALELLLQLAEQRPQDEQLRAKIEHIESVILARRDAAVAAARSERAETAEAEAEAVTEPISVRELFARMDRARPPAASSVTPRPISRRRSDFAPMPEGEATASEASDDPFAFPSPPAPSPVPRTSGPQQMFNPSTADPDDFNAWLRGLRGP